MTRYLATHFLRLTKNLIIVAIPLAIKLSISVKNKILVPIAFACFGAVNYWHIYGLGFLLVGSAIFISPTSYYFILPVLAGILFFTIAFSWQFGRILFDFWNRSHPTTRAIFSILSATVLTAPYAIASIIAEHKVTNLTGHLAVFFPNSLSIFTPVFFIYLTVAITGTLLILANSLLMIIMAFRSGTVHFVTFFRNIFESILRIKLPNHDEPLFFFKAMLFIFGMGISGTVFLGITSYIEIYQEAIDRHFFKPIIAISDHYQRSDCVNHPIDARISPLKDNWVSVATYDVVTGWSFDLTICEDRLGRPQAAKG